MSNNEHCVLRFEPKNKSQQEVINAYKESDLIFVLGSAGVGKSHISLAVALKDVLDSYSKIKKLVITKPLIEAERSIGSLPGGVGEKISPHISYLWGVIDNMAYNLPKDCIEAVPLSFLRGHTFNNTVAILDEAQNATYMQLKLFLTRMGKDCKLILIGDPEQSDIGNKSGLNKVVDLLSDIPEISIVKFSNKEVLRHTLVQKILQRLQ